MFKLNLIILILLVWQPCQAQINNVYFHHLTVENGLSEATNFYTYKDSRGFVWISSLSGLNRFDGRQVRVYQPESADTNTLLGQNIQSRFFEDDAGDIWFSTYEGINRYVRKKDAFRHYTLYDSLNQKPFSGYFFSYLDKKRSQIWILVENIHVYIFEIKTERFIKKHTLTTSVQWFDIQTDAQKKVLRSVGYKETSLGLQLTLYLDDGKIQQETLFGATSTTPLSIRDVLIENNTFWLCTDKGLFNYDCLTKQLKTVYLNNELKSISRHNEDELLLTTFKSGLFVFDKKSHQIAANFRHLDNLNYSISSDKSWKTGVDIDGGLWAQVTTGVDYMTLAKSKFKTFYHYPTDKTLTKNFDANALVLDENGALWSGSGSNGIKQKQLNGTVIDSFRLQNGTNAPILNVTFQSFRDNKNRIWFLNFGLLAYSNDKKSFFTKTNAPNNLFFYGFTTKSGKSLIATINGVCEIKEPQKDKFQFEPIKNIPADKPHSILFEDDNGLIWGSYDAVSVRIYDPRKDYQLVKELPINGVITGFWHQPNTSIVWMSSQNGLFKIDKNTWQSKVYTEQCGLPSRTINALLPDEKGHLWLGTSKGLAQFDPSIEKAQAYNLVDGLSDLNINLYAATKAPDGRMYFGTSNGITTFYPKNITPLSILARPTITQILINDLPAKNLVCTKTDATNVSEIEALELPYSDNTVSFNFSAMEYSDPMRCQFQYKMVGVDNDWVNSGTQNFTRYANLKAGTYTFLLKASNSDGVWAKNVKQLIIKILPPWYQTWQFRVLLALLALGFIYVYYRNRINQIKHEAEEKRKEAEYKQLIAETETAVLRLQMNPHFIFNSLNSINSYIHQKDIDTASDYLTRFAKLMRTILTLSETPLIPIENEIQFLESYLKTEAMRFEKSFSYKIEVDDAIDPDEMRVPTMLLQPFVENAIWHGLSSKSGEGLVQIRFYLENEQLICSVQDNGSGRVQKQHDPNHVSKALSITEKRLKYLMPNTDKRLLEIIDLTDPQGKPSGTKVCVYLPTTL